MLNGAFHGTLIRADATRQQLYLLVSCSNKPHLKQTTLTFWIRCLRTAANNNSPGQEVQPHDQFTVTATVSGQMNRLIYTAPALRQRSCKKLKETPLLN